MRNRQETLRTRGRRFFLVGLMLALIAPAAEAQLVVYDDFAAPRIDETRWAGRQFVDREDGTGVLLEIQREVSNQALVLQTRVVGGTASDSGLYSAENALAFQRPRDLTEVAFTVKVRSLQVKACAGGTASEAGARGVFALFNDGVGDIVAVIGATRSSASASAADQLDVAAFLVHRTPDGDAVLGSLSLGSAMLGESVKLRMRWEPAKNRVRFQRDGDALVSIDYTNPVVSAPGGPRKYLGAVAAAGDCSAGAGAASVTAAFNTVRVNP
jgi:hypothetical protein